MSDRVAIIGGKTVGRDHFPFPLGDFGGSTSTAYLSLTIQQFAWMFYRVKKWRVHGSATRTPLIGSPQSYSWDWIAVIGDGAEDGTDVSTLTRESDLVLSPTLNSNDDMGNPDGGNVGVEMFDSNAFDTGIRSRVSASLFSDAIGVFVTTDSEGLTATAIDGNIVILGENVPLIFCKESSDTSTVTGTFTIEPSEYWPYATKAGAPVYDTSTGEQLAGPFS